MKKQCDNCSKELSKFSFFSLDKKKKVYMYNSAMLCQTCFEEVGSHHQQLEEQQPQ